MKKKFLAGLLSFVMILSLLPITALATEYVAQIGETKYKTLAEAVAAANTDETVVIIANEDYTLPNIPKNIIIKAATGVEAEINAVGSGSICSIPNGVTFENLSFDFGTSSYHGFQHAGKIVMKDCTLNGLLFSYGDMEFNGCTFNATGEEYSMWCYGDDIDYNNCVFNGHGKFLNVYNEGNNLGKTEPAWVIEANGCTFNSDKANKAAFNVKESCGDKMLKYDVYINNCSAVGDFPVASESDMKIVFEPLVQVDDRKPGEETGITVKLNGVQVYPVIPVECVVSFNSNGGTSVPSQNVSAGDCAREPSSVPTKEGYDFVCWTLASGKFDFNRKITESITLNAKWATHVDPDAEEKTIVEENLSEDVKLDKTSVKTAEKIADSITEKALSGSTSNGISKEDARKIAEIIENADEVTKTIEIKADIDVLDEKEEKKIDNVSYENETIIEVFDLSIELTVSNGKKFTTINLTELDQELLFELKVDPTKIAKKAVRVIRIHEGVAEETKIQKIDYEKGLVYILADRFSKYSVLADEKATVVFNTNGGSLIENQTVELGEKVTKPADPKKDNVLFDGWYTDKELTKKFDFNTPIDNHITLYAKWIALPPKTNDSNNPFIWMLIGALSLALIGAGITVLKIKNNN